MLKRILSLSVIVCFFLTTLSPLPKAHADSLLGLPAPGTMINLSPAYEPVMIKGLTVHKDNPFLFDFIVDVGQDKMSGEPLKKEGEKLIKYFLASLAIPDKDAWVNLSPYEKNRMIPEALGQTDMGRDLLAQDYILKQITASLIYPERDLGRKFWDKVYSKAQQMYGTTQIPVNTFNKVWIMADRAEVFEHNQTAFVVDSHLKVMLEEDYLALQKHSVTLPLASRNDTHSVGANIVRQIILPELEKEVNTGKNFANLRQIFNSIILASWYKKNLAQALLNQVYANKSKVKGINLNDPTVKQQIYEQYLKAYKKGVFNYIKEDVNAAGATIPRKYFSGGMRATVPLEVITNPELGNKAMAAQYFNGEVDFATLASTQPTNFDGGRGSSVFKQVKRLDSDDARLIASLPIEDRNTIQALKRKFELLRRGVSYNAAMMASSRIYRSYDEMYQAIIKNPHLRDADFEISYGNGKKQKAFVYGSAIVKEKESILDPETHERISSSNFEEAHMVSAAMVASHELSAKAVLHVHLIRLLSDEQLEILEQKSKSTIDPKKKEFFLIKTLWLMNNEELNLDLESERDPARALSYEAEINASVAFIRSTLSNNAYNSLMSGAAVDTEMKSRPNLTLANLSASLEKSSERREKTSVFLSEVMNFIHQPVVEETSTSLLASIYYLVKVLQDQGYEKSEAENYIISRLERLLYYLKLSQEVKADKYEMLRSRVVQQINYLYAKIDEVNAPNNGNEMGNPSHNKAMNAEGTENSDDEGSWKLALYRVAVGGILVATVAMGGYELFQKGVEAEIERTRRAAIAVDGYAGSYVYPLQSNDSFDLVSKRTGVSKEALRKYNPDTRLEVMVVPGISEYPIEFHRNGENREDIAKILFGDSKYAERILTATDGGDFVPYKDQWDIGPTSKITILVNPDERKALDKRLKELVPGSYGSYYLRDRNNISSTVPSAADKIAFTNATKKWVQGGIDLNTSNGMQWKVSKDGNGVEMNIDPAMIERIKREGIDSLSPVILRMTPVASIWPLVGLQASEHLAV